MNQATRKFGMRAHTNEPVVRRASWALEIGHFSHDADPPTNVYI